MPKDLGVFRSMAPESTRKRRLKITSVFHRSQLLTTSSRKIGNGIYPPLYDTEASSITHPWVGTIAETNLPSIRFRAPSAQPTTIDDEKWLLSYSAVSRGPSTGRSDVYVYSSERDHSPGNKNRVRASRESELGLSEYLGCRWPGGVLSIEWSEENRSSQGFLGRIANSSGITRHKLDELLARCGGWLTSGSKCSPLAF